MTEEGIVAKSPLLALDIVCDTLVSSASRTSRCLASDAVGASGFLYSPLLPVAGAVLRMLQLPIVVPVCGPMPARVQESGPSLHSLSDFQAP